MKILITEQEKNEILNKHKNFKKILENELSKLNRGLVIEQNNNEKLVIDLDDAKKNGCLTNGNFGEKSGKRAWIKRAKNAKPGKFDIGDEIVQYGDGTYEVYTANNPSTPKGTFKWRCPEVNTSSIPASIANQETTTPVKSTDSKPTESLNNQRTTINDKVKEFLDDFRPEPKNCVKTLEYFYETWENNVTQIDPNLFNELKSNSQTCANYFNGSWKGVVGRGPIRKKIDVLQGTVYGGPSGTSKWRLEKPVDPKRIKRR